ncbi:MAG: Amidohydro-rel protein [Chloroflexi bacterium]|nr:Amidohydro-rel protein [Chloroflexota bacterium]
MPIKTGTMLVRLPLLSGFAILLGLLTPGPTQSVKAQPAAAFYTGPLFSTHEHIGIVPGKTALQDALFYGEAMSQHGVKRMLVFVSTNVFNRPGQAERDIRGASEIFPASFAPFVPFPRSRRPEDFPQFAAGLREMFAEGPFWRGLGELHSVCAADREPDFYLVDTPNMLLAYDVVAEFDRTVMVHAGSCHEPLERALAYNRRAPFLVHGHQVAQVRFPCQPRLQEDDFLPCMDVTRITGLMQAHPNFFYDVALTANPHMHLETVSGVDVKTHYRGHMEAHVENAVQFYGAAFQAFPDRFLWGLDSGSSAFNFDSDFYALGIEFYRRLLGRLPRAAAEKIAFRNAERLILRIPTLEGPDDGATLATQGATFSWLSPPNTAQYQIQFVPANSDGPAINVVRDAASSFSVEGSVLGLGPGTSYSWRVRTTAATASIEEDSPLWRPWSDTRAIRTAGAESLPI